MSPGAKRTLIARLMAGAGCLFGILGSTLSPAAYQIGEHTDFDWFAAGTLLLVFAIYVLVDGAMAFQKSQS